MGWTTETTPRFMQLEARNSDISPERSEILERARREAAARGWSGEPVIVAETETGRGVTFLIEFPAAAPRPPQQRNTPGSQYEQQRRGSVSWLMVIPMVESHDGRVTWERSSEWVRGWMVPQRRGTMRILSTAGDSEDREMLPDRSISNPDILHRGLAFLARKYSAPAVAAVILRPTGDFRVVVSRGGGVRNGNGNMASGSEQRAIRESALDVIQTLLAPQGDSENSGMMAEERISPILRVLGSTPLPGRGIRVTILNDTSDADEQAEARRLLRSLSGFIPISYSVGFEGLEITGTWNDTEAALEQALSRAGATVER
jgi:hypothetical protein